MPRYFFHIRRGSDFEDKDPDGEDLADLEAARAKAVQIARDYWEDWPDAETGMVIDIADEAGQTVLTVPFSDAIDRP
jgi:hypothetical protein